MSNKVTISVLGKLNTDETKATIIRQLDNIGKVTNIKFGVDNTNLIKTLEESRVKAIETQKAYAGIADVSKLTYDLNGKDLKLQEKIVIDKNKVLNIAHNLLDAEKTKVVATDKTVENNKKILADDEKKVKLAKEEYNYAVYLNSLKDKNTLAAKEKEIALAKEEYNYAVYLNQEYDKQTASLIENARVKSQSSKIKTDSAEELAQNKAINKSLEEKWILESKNAENIKNATIKMNKEREASDEKYWNGRFENQLKDRTTTNDTLKQMKTYYSGIEAEQKKEQSSVDALNKKKQNLIDTLEREKIKAEQVVQTSKEFGNATTRSQVEKYANEIKNLSVKTDATEEDLAKMNQQLNLSKTNLSGAAKESKVLGNNSMTMGNMLKTALPKFIA